MISLSTAFTGLEIELINGVTAVDAKAWALGANEVALREGNADNWRSHINVVECDLTKPTLASFTVSHAALAGLQ